MSGIQTNSPVRDVHSTTWRKRNRHFSRCLVLFRYDLHNCSIVRICSAVLDTEFCPGLCICAYVSTVNCPNIRYQNYGCTAVLQTNIPCKPGLKSQCRSWLGLSAAQWSFGHIRIDRIQPSTCRLPVLQLALDHYSKIWMCFVCFVWAWTVCCTAISSRFADSACTTAKCDQNLY